MTRLIIELSPVPVDMGAKPEKVKIGIIVIKNSQIIKVLGWDIKTTLDTVKIAVNDDSNECIRKVLSYNPYSARLFICTALSMVNPDVIFSPLDWNVLPATVEEERTQNSPPRVYEATKVAVKFMQIEMDEIDIIKMMEKLFYHRFSDSKQKTVHEENITDSINSYQLALMSPLISPRFTFLFHSFEKAVNADGKDATGKDFDGKASALTGIVESEIEELHTFYNRIKHALREEKDILTMERGIENFSELALKLKKATDAAILARITNARP